jgi:hypothetical protein
MLQFLVTANVVPNSLTLCNLMTQAISSSETEVLRKAAWRHITEDDILHSLPRDNLKSYIVLIGWAL